MTQWLPFVISITPYSSLLLEPPSLAGICYLTFPTWPTGTKLDIVDMNWLNEPINARTLVVYPITMQKDEGPYTITQVYCNGTVRIQRVSIYEQTNIKRLTPYIEES
jgi:hypothetical protein